MSSLKNDEEENKGEDKSQGKSGRLICRLCVVQSSITSHLFMRRLDFLYKKRTKIIKKPNLTRTGIFGNFPDQLGLTDWFASVPPSERGQLSVTFCNFPDQLGLTD